LGVPHYRIAPFYNCCRSWVVTSLGSHSVTPSLTQSLRL
jgi:hypothetical protein